MLERLRPGAEIDGFTIGDRLHSGAMGNIFSVTKPGYTQPLIMKVPRVGPNEPSEGIISFETEATVVPALHGPHVPPFVAVGDLARTPYLITEWVDGQNLEDLVQEGPLPFPQVAHIGAAIADALHSLHQQDVIHHDLKPGNVILKRDGTAVLIDFGFAHHARYPDLLAEETRFAAGSAAYVSPEQLLGTREDPRSDIFALGVLMYEAATGKLPFGEPDTDPRNRLWFDPVPPSTHAQDLPPWLQEIILRCIEARADQRYQSAAHVAFDLRNPEQVTLTNRATKSKQAGVITHVKRFLRARGEHGKQLRAPNVLVSRSPIVMVAVDTMHMDDERQPAIRRATSQVLSLSKEFRLICVTVIPTRVAMDGAHAADTASGIHLEHLVRLRHWVDPLRLPAQRLSLHAIESDDPAETIVEFARLNNVDLIVLGAPADSGRAWTQSVASTVSANARCSVHLVRVPER